MAQSSNAPRSQEEYITQVSEEIEGRVTKSLSMEFSRTENRFLGALARLDNFLMSPLLQGHSGTTPEPSRNALSASQGTNEDDSQNNPHPEAGLSHAQMIQNSGLEDGHDSNASQGDYQTICPSQKVKKTTSVIYFILSCFSDFFCESSFHFLQFMISDKSMK